MGDHLIVMHSAVRALPGYNRHDAPAILMDGPSVDALTEQGRAVTAQLAEPHGDAQRRDARRDDRPDRGRHPAGHPRARPARRPRTTSTTGSTCRRSTPLTSTRRSRRRLEPLPDADVQGAREHRRARRRRRVRGPARAVRRGCCRIEDLRRRVEDDWPEALVAAAARALRRRGDLSRSDEPGDDGWAYFLDLWTEDGPARLHIEGEMALTADGRFLVSLNDILP